jgi:hypothetical protein
MQTMIHNIETATEFASAPAKAIALDIVNTARRIGALQNPILTKIVKSDVRRAISTMRNLLTELDFELDQ